MAQQSTRPTDHIELQRVQLASEARDVRQSPSSAPSFSRGLPSSERHLIEENESLKAELKLLKAQLKTQQTKQHPLHQPPLRRTMSLKTRKPIEARSSVFKLFSSPPRNTVQHESGGIFGKPTTGQQPMKQHAFRKINRHPSDTNDSTPQRKSEDIDKHGSGRGLKNRKHPPHSPSGTIHHERSRPRSPPSAPRTPEGRRMLPFVDPFNENGAYYDSERASLLEVAVTSPPLNRTISTGSNGSKSSDFHQHKHEHDGANNNKHPQQQRPPQHSFFSAVSDRAGWLVGLLILQSMSSFIISRNEKLLQQHLVIVRFLTMLVGAGGNAGNQASVGTCRGLFPVITLVLYKNVSLVDSKNLNFFSSLPKVSFEASPRERSTTTISKIL